MNKGEIWILNFPKKGGKEQHGIRPAIILANTGTNIILAVPLTSNLQARHFPHTLEIKKSERNNLEKDSIALIFQLQASDKERFISKIGELEQFSLNEINKILRNLLKL